MLVTFFNKQDNLYQGQVLDVYGSKVGGMKDLAPTMNRTFYGDRTAYLNRTCSYHISSLCYILAYIFN